jgi:hypothetical protein
MKTISAALFGAPLDPFSSQTRQHIALVAFLAWIGLGADGLSSSCYGPEEAFLALGEHSHLALYMAAATALTVFVIAVAYNQVIELFPSGGGGYKVATNLIGPYTGLVSGAALIVGRREGRGRCHSGLSRLIAWEAGAPERRFTVGGSAKSVARCHRTVLAYWKFESISLQRRVRCEPVSRGNSPSYADKPPLARSSRIGWNTPCP